MAAVYELLARRSGSVVAREVLGNLPGMYVRDRNRFAALVGRIAGKSRRRLRVPLDPERSARGLPERVHEVPDDGSMVLDSFGVSLVRTCDVVTAVFDGRYRSIFSDDLAGIEGFPADAPSPFIFDLEADPNNQQNIAEVVPDTVDRLTKFCLDGRRPAFRKHLHPSSPVISMTLKRYQNSD